MSLLFYSLWGKEEEVWAGHLKKGLKDIPLYFSGDIDKIDKDEINFAAVWKPPKGYLEQFPNLKVIFSLGAGVDHLYLNETSIAEDIPILRTVVHSLSQGMCEYVLYQVLKFHRHFYFYDTNQRQDHIWKRRRQIPPSERSIGIMGYGELGQDVAKILRYHDFNVVGWKQTKLENPDIEVYYGEDELETFLNKSQMLVCLLPLTAKTDGILNWNIFEKMPDKSFLIHAGRGQQLVEKDFLEALDQGKLEAAAIDVFHQEPLPPDHPFWDNPKITITPHIASITDSKDGSEFIIENIKRYYQNQPLQNVMNRQKGY